MRGDHSPGCVPGVVHTTATLLGTFVRELRAPLQGVLSALDVLELHLHGAAHDSAEIVARMRRSADALEARWRDLATLAKAEAGTLKHRPTPFDASGLVEYVAGTFVQRAEDSGIELVVHLPERPLRAVADPSYIGKVLTILIDDAVKHTGRGRVEVTLEPDAQRGDIVLTVRDTGQHIRARRYRTPIGEHDEASDAGHVAAEDVSSGLALVHALVRRLEGGMDVRYEDGRGRSVRVRVYANASAAPAPPLSAGGLQVLIVGDGSDGCEGMARVVRDMGYSCDSTANAALAGDLLATRSYDLALVDLDLPEKRGAALAAHARLAGGLNAETRMVAMSAGEDRRAAGWPFDGFLRKPLDRKLLRQVLGGSVLELR